jgi:hypothetical protein
VALVVHMLLPADLILREAQVAVAVQVKLTHPIPVLPVLLVKATQVVQD